MTTTHTPILDPSIRAVIDAGRTLERHIERVVSPTQVATLLVLDELYGDPGITLTPLAAALGLERQTVFGVLARMEKNGLLERRRDEQDKRISHHYLTPRGVVLRAECYDKLNIIDAKLAAMIDRETQDGARDLALRLEHFAP